jgi:predicted secreted protein
LFFLGIIIVVLVTFPFVYSVGASSLMWSQTYGGIQNDLAYSLVETSDGGFAVTGVTDSYGAQHDIWLIKTDETGTVRWNQTYEYGEAKVAVVETSDGGYALAGSKQLIKTDEYGNIEWNQTYKGDEFEKIYSFVQTADGGYALAGQLSYANVDPEKGWSEGWLAKTDEKGNVEWTRTYGGENGERVNSLIETADGGFALAGSTGSFGAGGDDFWLVKTDSNGNMIWNRVYGGIFGDKAQSLVVTSDGGFALAGTETSFGGDGSHDFWLIKTDSNGNMEWNQTHGGEGYDYLSSMIATSDGGYALAGYTGSFDVEKYDFWLVKTDKLGNIPEFPSWTILPLFLVATLSVLVIKKRLFHKQ